jgi:hypothetical protein
MANSLKVHQIIAREAAAILEESAPFLTQINRDREEDLAKNQGGYKTGQTVTISIPKSGKVYDGATFAGGGAATDVQEDSVALTLDIHKHAGVTFSAKEILTDVTEWRERVLRPQISTLAASLEAEFILRAVQATPWLVGTAGATPTSMKTFSQARQRLQLALAPTAPRTCLMSSEVNVELVDTSKALFNPAPSIAKMYREGMVSGVAQGATWFECVNLPTITNGNKVAGVTISGAGQTGSTLVVGGVLAGDTFKKGQVFTCGVKAVHPLTGAAYTTDQQFVIMADTTSAGATVSLSIYPAIVTAMPGQTVNASPANGAALTFQGAASTGYMNSLMFQRDAFTAAFKPLKVVAGAEGYTYSANGITLTVQTFGNGTNLTESTRIDVLGGFAAVRGIHACRVVQ